MNTGSLACGDKCDRTENLTEVLENSRKQIVAITDQAKAIKRKIDGDPPAIEGYCSDKNEKYPGIPGLYRQALDNTNLLAELYEIILTIDSRL